MTSYENDFLRFLQNAHIYHYTKDTLEQVLNWHGFEPIYANEKVEALFRIGTKKQDVKNYYEGIRNFLDELEKIRQDKANKFHSICEKALHEISEYKTGEVAVYGTGKEADRFMNEIGRPEQIKGFLTKDMVSGQFRGYSILDINSLAEIKCIIIAANVYREAIYERIKYLEEEGIKIVQLYE